MKKLLSILLAFVLLFSACAKSSTTETLDQIENLGSKERPVKIGVVGENNEVWESVKERLEAQDIFLEIITFTSYNEPNEALVSRDLDLNSFQHQHFLDNFNKEKKSDISSVAQTVLAPLGLYSKKITDISQVKEGDKIAIPDDVTNGSRSLILLQSAGLIKVDGQPGEALTLDNISENPLKLEIIELEANQTARALDEVVLSSINNGLATDAGFVPTQDAVFLEAVDENSKPFINIIAANASDVNNDIVKKIVAEYQTDMTAIVIDESTKGSQIPAWNLE